MIITDIVTQKKDENRMSIYIDNEFSFGASKVDVLFYKLKINEEISEEKLNMILENIVYTKARDTAFRFLGFKARTEKELYDKLTEKEFSEDVSMKIVEEMKKYKYIDDETYAKNFLKEKMNYKGIGTQKIKFMLSQKGVNRNIIDSLFYDDNFEEEQIKKITELINIKLRRTDIKNITEKEKKKVYDFLLRRGYTYNIINDAFKEVFNASLEEDYEV